MIGSMRPPPLPITNSLYLHVEKNKNASVKGVEVKVRGKDKLVM